MKTMNTPPADSASLEARVAALEAENRDLHWRVSQLRFLAAMLGVGLLLYAAFHAAFAAPIKATVVEAQRVVLRDATGRVRLVLGSDENLPATFNNNPGLLLFDENGHLRGQLNATDDVAGLRLLAADGRGPRVEVTHGPVTSGVWLKDKNDSLRAALALDGSGPRVDLLDEEQRTLPRQP
jgi:hypothetical protein